MIIMQPPLPEQLTASVAIQSVIYFFFNIIYTLTAGSLSCCAAHFSVNETTAAGMTATFRLAKYDVQLFAYFRPVLKATPTPTHSRLMQTHDTHIKMFSLKRSLYYISMRWFPCPGTVCRASRRAWEKPVKKHSHSCCHHHGSLMSNKQRSYADD